MAVRLEILGERWRSGVAFYDIGVACQGRRWTAKKRYSDFVALDDELELRSKLARAALPGKGCFGLRHRLNLFSFNRERRDHLALYLDRLAGQVQTVGDCPPLAKFLDSGSSAGREGSCSPPLPAAAAVAPPAPSAPVASELTTAPAAVGRPAARPLKDFKPHFDEGCFDCLQWVSFERSEPALAISIRRCAELVGSSARFQNHGEEVFQGLRRNLLASARRQQSCLDEVPLDARGFVWDFLVLVAARRPFYRAQAAEVARALEGRCAWAEVTGKVPELRRLKEEVLAGA